MCDELMAKAKLFNYSFRCINISQIIYETLNGKVITCKSERKRIINSGLNLLDKLISGACLVKSLPRKNKRTRFYLDDLQDYNKVYPAIVKMTGGFHQIEFLESMKIALRSEDKKTLTAAREFFNLFGDIVQKELSKWEFI